MIGSLALIGAGPVGFGVVAELARRLQGAENPQKLGIKSIDIFDAILPESSMGAGLPYGAAADPEHLLNISTRLVSVPTYGDFDQFIKSNKDEIREFFSKIFKERFEWKFEKRFKCPYSDELMAKEPFIKEKEDLLLHYEKIWKSFQRRYLDVLHVLESQNSYPPRRLFGMYASKKFYDAISDIRKCGVVVNIHPQTEVNSLEKDQALGQMVLGFKGETKSFDRVILATGRALARAPLEHPRYISRIWPIKAMKEDIEKIIADEITKRKESGDKNKIIKIAICGASLSAIDVLKTIFQDRGVFEEKENGVLKFTPTLEDGYEIHVDMVSRGNVMQSVKGKSKAMVEGGLKEDLSINQKTLETLVKRQGKVHLWEVLLMFARSVECAYIANKQNDKAEKAKEIVKLIIENVFKAVAPDKIDGILASIGGGQFDQLLEIKKRFCLRDEVNYKGIFEEFRKVFFSKDPLSQLEDNLNLAQKGDVAGGFLVLRDILLQFDSLELNRYLNEEEKAFKSSPEVSRMIKSFINAMPVESAKEMIALRDAGLLNCNVVGYKSVKPEIINDQVVFRSSDKEFSYDLAINATGYNLDLKGDLPPLYQSMFSNKVIDLDDKGDIKCEVPEVVIPKVPPGLSFAYRCGIGVVTNLYKPQASTLQFSASASKNL